jgi:rubrerythrin
MAVVLIIMAVITFMFGFVFSPDSAMQQIVQYLVYTCACVMLSCGLLGILIANKAGEIISAINNASKNKEYSKSQESNKPINSGDSWTCKSCGTENKNTDNACKDCGKYR